MLATNTSAQSSHLRLRLSRDLRPVVNQEARIAARHASSRPDCLPNRTRSENRYVLRPLDQADSLSQSSACGINERDHIVSMGFDDWTATFGYLLADATTTRLPSLPGAAYCYPLDLNDHDWVVGADYVQTEPGSPMAAWLWTPRMAVARRLPPLRATDAWVGATAVNDAGWIAGYSGPILNTQEDAVIWPPDHSRPIKLRDLPGRPAMCAAISLNNNSPPRWWVGPEVGTTPTQ